MGPEGVRQHVGAGAALQDDAPVGDVGVRPMGPTRDRWLEERRLPPADYHRRLADLPVSTLGHLQRRQRRRRRGAIDEPSVRHGRHWGRVGAGHPADGGGRPLQNATGPARFVVDRGSFLNPTPAGVDGLARPPCRSKVVHSSALTSYSSTLFSCFISREMEEPILTFDRFRKRVAEIVNLK